MNVFFHSRLAMALIVCPVFPNSNVERIEFLTFFSRYEYGGFFPENALTTAAVLAPLFLHFARDTRARTWFVKMWISRMWFVFNYVIASNN